MGQDTGKNRQTDQAPYYFHQGTSVRAYEYLGARREGEKLTFRVWAPNAERVTLCGEFDGWGAGIPMERNRAGDWELTLSGETIPDGTLYKYRIERGGNPFYKADPYGRMCETPPGTATRLLTSSEYVWRDAGWMNYRKKHFTREKVISEPMNVYEVHLGSWKKKEDGSFLSYREAAGELVTYVKQMGYTHIELMPVAEHPFDGSWGYQVTGYYAPTSRFGTPDDFRAFVDTFHEAGIGVILDWVPAHFPKDAHGLYEFDGAPLYEYQGADRMENRGWGTRCFDVGREEVQSFLISNAVYWAEEFHVDGLRVDAVASMLYLDYDRKPGEWVPNVRGGRESLEAIAFFQKLNGVMAKDYPDVLTVAEESTAWAHITGFEENGLGFSLKWNMGWMNDMLAYSEEDPLWRRDHHEKLTFAMTYAFSEKYLLPVSHDEVVHGKKSFLDRMPGEYDLKFAGLRAFLAYQMTHPGKKLLFMGSEIGQFREWDFAGQIEWFLLDYEKHAKLQRYVAELNRFYLENAPLWERDGDWSGFSWIDADNRDQSVYSFRRIDAEGREIVILLNFVPIKRENFLLAVPCAGLYREVFNSDAVIYGGEGNENPGEYRTEPAMLRGYGNAVRITVPAMSAVMFRCVRKFPVRRPKKAKDTEKPKKGPSGKGRKE